MPTQNPRVQVTLSPSLDALVQSLAIHTQASKSQVLRELLESAEPALRRAVALMDAASMAAQEVRLGMGRSLDQAQTRIEQSMSSALSALDTVTGDLVAQAEAVKARRPRRSAAPAATGSVGGASVLLGGAVELQDPRPSKRGVKSSRRVPQGVQKGGKQ